MAKKKAQLILVGGRTIPNVLTIIHQKPEVIVAICSHESFTQEWPTLKQGIENLLPSCEIKAADVDGFDLPQIRAACEEALKCAPDADWLFNITTATTVMSIGAYEAAQKYADTKSIECWYLDTAKTRIIPLIGEGTKEQVFQIEIEQYAAIHNCRLVSGSLEDKRGYSEQTWLPFAQLLGKNPQYADPLKEFIKSISHQKPRKEEARTYPKLKLSDAAYRILEKASEVGLVDSLQKDKEFTSLRISHIQVAFLDGAWLEAYVWNEAHKLEMFSDCQWNQKLVDSKKLTDKDPKNELDVSMLYKAQLLVVECKTGDDAFEPSTLYKLDSVANTLGGKFVGRLLVTSLPDPNGNDPNKQKQFEEFKDKAKERNIVLATRELLPKIGEILVNLAKYPKR